MKMPNPFMDEFAASKGCKILTLPTGQGLLLKPPAARPGKGFGSSLGRVVLNALRAMKSRMTPGPA